MVAIEEMEEIEEAPQQAEAHQALLDAHGGDPFALLRATFSFLHRAHPAAFADSTAADKVLAALKGTPFALSHCASRSPSPHRRCRGDPQRRGIGHCRWAQKPLTLRGGGSARQRAQGWYPPSPPVAA
jgi:hypothetical protein